MAVCGGGNNGGDGWCAARLLSDWGYETAVYTLTDKLSADCAAQRELYGGKVYAQFPEDTFDVLIDAVFGTGFHGAPEGVFLDAIERMNKSGVKIVSADIPSGLNGDTGTYFSCVQAAVTVTIGELKGGLLLSNGPDVCGKIVRKDIGIQLPERAAAGRSEAEDFIKIFPPRKKIRTREVSERRSYWRAVLRIRARLFCRRGLRSAAAAAIRSLLYLKNFSDIM